MGKPIVINDPSLYKVRSRTNAKGVTKSKISIEVKSQPILLDYDKFTGMKATAEAFKDFIQEKGRHVSAPVSASTRAAREKVIKNHGSSWVKRRYAGGRTGATPGQSGNIDKGLYFSGRLVEGFSVRQNSTDKSFTVNVPANRLVLPGQTNSSSRNMTDFQRLLDYLDRHLPWFRDPARALAESKKIRAATETDMAALVMVASERGKMLRAQRNAMIRQFGAGAFRALLV